MTCLTNILAFLMKSLVSKTMAKAHLILAGVAQETESIMWPSERNFDGIIVSSTREALFTKLQQMVQKARYIYNDFSDHLDILNGVHVSKCFVAISFPPLLKIREEKPLVLWGIEGEIQTERHNFGSHLEIQYGVNLSKILITSSFQPLLKTCVEKPQLQSNMAQKARYNYVGMHNLGSHLEIQYGVYLSEILIA